MWADYLKAFLVGGALCALGQVLIDRTKLTPARILTCYVVLGVVLHAVGVYAPLIEWAGAGASVPLTGFGSTLAKGVEKAVAEKGFLGAFPGGRTPPGLRGRHRRGDILRVSRRRALQAQGEKVIHQYRRFPHRTVVNSMAITPQPRR